MNKRDAVSGAAVMLYYVWSSHYLCICVRHRDMSPRVRLPVDEGGTEQEVEIAGEGWESLRLS